MTKHIFLKKGFAVGIILLFIGVAVAPSINISIVKASNDTDLVEIEKINSLQLPPKGMNNYHIKDTVNNLVGLLFIKHPLLLKIIQIIVGIRLSVINFLTDYSTKKYYHGSRPEIIHPMVFLLALALIFREGIGILFWLNIAEILNWGWTLDDVNPN